MGSVIEPYIYKIADLFMNSFQYSMAGQAAFTAVEFKEVSRGLFDELEKAEDVVWYEDVPSVCKVSDEAQIGIRNRLVLENMIVFPNNIGRLSDVKFACKGLKFAWKEFTSQEKDRLHKHQ